MGRNFVCIRCPWEDQHTTQSDDSATVLFVPGAGYTDYAFDCRHAHCADRTTSDFFAATGVDLLGLTNIDEEEEEVRKAFELERADQTRRGVSPVSGPRFDRDKNGKIKWTIPNMIEALSCPDIGGMAVSYDTFRDHITVHNLEENVLSRLEDDHYTQFFLRCAARGFVSTTGYPIAQLRAAFRRRANKQKVDSAQDWLNSLPEWDRVRRVNDFCTTYLGVEPTPYSRAVGRYWWTAHAGRVLSPGCQADMAIVLVSGQGTGKTSTVKAMVPYDDWFCELDFNTDDANLSRAMRGKLIGELAELRGLSDGRNDAIKARISRRRECWIEKYQENDHVFQRRLVLVGTGNNPEFLSDETGNRRWLPIEVGEKQHVDQLVRDRDQLWAEAAHLWREGGVQWREAQSLGKREHAAFETRDAAWEERVAEWLREEGLGGERAGDLEYLTISQVLEGALRLDPGKQQLRDQHRIGRVMKQLGYEKCRIREDGRIIKVWKRIGAS